MSLNNNLHIAKKIIAKITNPLYNIIKKFFVLKGESINMKRLLKRAFALSLAITAIPVAGLPVSPTVTAAENSVKVVLNPSYASPFNDGRFEGWGTSLCWWANRLGYSEQLTQQSADYFFSEEGLGLDIARYNLGGGDDPTHNHITRSDSKVPGYATGFDENGDIVYDWTADENQRNITLAALKANPDLYIEGFSNSPPYFMTNSGCSSGATDAGSDNLRADMVDDFAKFIAQTTKYFKDNFGITFESYSPMNEPDTTYWGALSWKQEGCHYDPGDSQSRMLLATREALDAEGLNDVLVVGMDETSIDQTITNLAKLSPEALEALGRIDTHTYGGSQRKELRTKAMELGRTLWMSEVDNGNVAGTNPGNMGAGLALAEHIIADMNGMQPAAWVMWDIVDYHRDADFTGEENNVYDHNNGLWGVAFGNHDTQQLELTQKYYVFGQFTKYILPGDTIIASSDNTLAAYNKDTGAIKIVAMNRLGEAKNYEFDLSAFTQTGDSAQVIRTSGSITDGEHWADLGTAPVNDKILSYELPANSVTTFVIDNNIDNIGYITVDGADIATKGSDYVYTASTSDNSNVTWSVSDESIATINPQTGILTILKNGTVDVIASSETVGSNSKTVSIVNGVKLDITSDMVTGSNPWNGNTAYGPQKAADGSLSTYFDGLNGGYVTYDLGTPYTIGMVAYAPREGYEYRMLDGIISGSSDGTTWTQLYQIGDIPPSNTLTYVTALSNIDTPYRYVRYSIPSGKQTYNGSSEDYNCNLSELVIYADMVPLTDEEDVEKATASIAIPSEAYGNLNMPSETNGVAIEWTSSDEAVITTNGIVTRGDTDNIVYLTANLTKGNACAIAHYEVTVKAKAQGKSEDDMEAYLFTHFVGAEGDANCEQIYFSLSRDGITWTTLNEAAPILTSTVGEKGVRDPHIIRSPEGDKFFIVATDLSIYNRRDDSNRWGTCQTSGSKSIVIWESTDLVNWSEARLVKVAPDNAGCTWAPETVYDDATGRYMVFWASRVAGDNYSKQRVYRSYTRDFVNFTPAEIYIETDVNNIDTTFLKEDGVYYRFTKNESKSSVIMEESTSLDGPFNEVSTYTLNSTAGNTVTGYEGPTAYKLNGEDKWCLLLDKYSTSEGYKPFITENIAEGKFVSGTDFNFDNTYRHGTVMAITMDEYNALMTAYPPTGPAETGNLIFELDFENEAVPNLGTAKVNGTLTYADGPNGKAAVFDSTDFIEISNAEGKSLLSGLDTFTVSFYSKTNAQSWWFYAAPDTASQTYLSEKYTGVLDSNSKLTCERYNSNSQARPTAASANYTNGQWKHVVVSYSNQSYSLYVDGVRKATIRSDVAIDTLLGTNPIAYIGKANWGSGEYSSGMIDEFRVYDYAMSEEDAEAEYLLASGTATPPPAETEAPIETEEPEATQKPVTAPEIKDALKNADGISFTLTNSADKAVTVIIAQYGSNGRLISVTTRKNVTVLSDEETISVVGTFSENRTKIMVWSDMESIAAAVEL